MRLLAFGTVCLIAPSTFAQEWPRAAPDVDPTLEAGPPRTVDRTWLYNDDARVPDPLTVIGLSSFSYTNVGGAATRAGSPYPYSYSALAGNTAQPGGVLAIGGELGLLPRLSIVAIAQMGIGGQGPSPSPGGMAAFRVRLTPATWNLLRVVATAGYLRESWEGPHFDAEANKWYAGNANGANGAFGALAASGDVGRLRWTTGGHVEHVFSPGRDGVDLRLQVGANYNVAGPLRLGVEGVGQDLEEAFGQGAEGGARYFVGPTASAQLLGERLTIVGGPSVGLSASSPRVLGRVSLAYAF